MQKTKDTNQMADLSWHTRSEEDLERGSGIYFLRTNIASLWIVNTIRFQLKESGSTIIGRRSQG